LPIRLTVSTKVGVAADMCCLQAGDGLAHGLALTTDVEAFASRNQHYAMMPIGAALDSLCWLLDFVERYDQLGEHIYSREFLRAMIERTARKLYRDQPAELLIANAADHLWVWRRIVSPCIEQRIGITDVRRRLVDLYRDDQLFCERERMFADPQRRELDQITKWAQKKLLAQIQDRLIIVEMNPASNLRISGAPALGESPTVKLFKAVADGLLACINTDNPGIFAGCIENEYALLLQGALDAKMSHGEARGLLEEVRKIGMEMVYWPAASKTDASLEDLY
jgi:hypothetical protein